jgi:hypothetical protein
MRGSALAALFLLLTAAPATADIVRRAKVIDGDSLEIGVGAGVPLARIRGGRGRGAAGRSAGVRSRRAWDRARK